MIRSSCGGAFFHSACGLLRMPTHFNDHSGPNLGGSSDAAAAHTLQLWDPDTRSWRAPECVCLSTRDVDQPLGDVVENASPLGSRHPKAGEHLALWFQGSGDAEEGKDRRSPQQQRRPSCIVVARSTTLTPLWFVRMPKKSQHDVPATLLLVHAHCVIVVMQSGDVYLSSIASSQRRAAARHQFHVQGAVKVSNVTNVRSLCALTTVVGATPAEEGGESDEERPAAAAAVLRSWFVAVTRKELMILSIPQTSTVHNGSVRATTYDDDASDETTNVVEVVLRTPLPKRLQSAAAGGGTAALGARLRVAATTTTTTSAAAGGIIALNAPGDNMLYVARCSCDLTLTGVSSFQEIDVGFPSTTSPDAANLAATAPLLLGPFGSVGVPIARAQQPAKSSTTTTTRAPTGTDEAISGASERDRIVFVTLVPRDESGAPGASRGTKKSRKAPSTSQVPDDAFEAIVLPPLSLPPGMRLVGWRSGVNTSAHHQNQTTQRKNRSRRLFGGEKEEEQDAIILCGASSTMERAAADGGVVPSQRIEFAILPIKDDGLPTQQKLDERVWWPWAPSSSSLLYSTSSTALTNDAFPNIATAAEDDPQPLHGVPAMTRRSPASFVYPTIARLLTAAEDSDPIAPHVFRISASAFSTHTKISAQWVEGVEGVARMMRAAAVGSEVFRFRFHPQHLRAALRRLNGTELVALFSCAVSALSHAQLFSNRGDNNDQINTLRNSHVVANASDVAVQIVTLHRQLGLELPREGFGTENLFHFLKECRAMGHRTGAAAQRIKAMQPFVALQGQALLDPAWGADSGGKRGLHTRYPPRPSTRMEESSRSTDLSPDTAAAVVCDAAALLQRALNSSKLAEHAQKSSRVGSEETTYENAFYSALQ